MAQYIVHPGYGKASRTADESYIDGAELAALYGLGVDDYEIGSQVDEAGSPYDVFHIHLLPRPDGLYRNIKTELGDNGTDSHWDKMVNAKKWRKENEDHGINRYNS